MGSLRPKLFLAVIFILLTLFFSWDIFEDYQINFGYQPTSCIIMSKQLNNAQNSTYIPLVGVNYQANGKSYTSFAPAHHAYPNISFKFIANDLLNRYTINATIPCWYNPLQPDQIVLERGYHTIELAFIIEMLIFLLLYWAVTRVNRNYKPSGPIISTTQSGSFQVVFRKWTTEYIYQSSAPITEELLPSEFKRRSAVTLAYYINTIKKNGRFIQLHPTIAKLITLALILIFIAELLTLILQLLV